MAGQRGSTAAADEDDDFPPNSRLFVVCDKTCNESEFREAFGRYGTVEDVWVLKDRRTGDNKGIVYVKFSKTSQAAEALENLHGVTLDNHVRPLKVLVASNRHEGSKREVNETERLFRLFIVVPKDVTEEKLREHFTQFGEVVHVLIVKSKETGENKGFAYIKFAKASQAARAFESCNKSYRAVFAEPKPAFPQSREASSRGRERDRDRDRNGSDDYGGRGSYWARGPERRRMDDDIVPHRTSLYDGGMSNSDAYYTLNVVATAGVTQLQLWKLFDIIPGLESCDLHMKSCDFVDDPVYASVKYRSAQSASHAAVKLNNFEYPPGCPLTVRESESMRYTDSSYPRGSSQPMGSVDSGKIEQLTNALAQAQSIIKSAGLSAPSLDRLDFEEQYCSVQLPAPQPTAPLSATVAQRLFIVCTTKLLPKFILQDVFGRFTGLIDIYMLPGKTCGYVKYASEESANQAVNVLHGQEVSGVRLKVMLADPRQQSSTGGNQNKRLRTSE